MSGSDDVLGKALDRTLLRRIFAYVWPYKAQIAIAVLLLPITSGMEIAQPYLLKKAIDEHIGRGQLAGLDRLGIFYLAVSQRLEPNGVSEEVAKDAHQLADLDELTVAG